MIGFDRQVTISIKNISSLIQNVKTLYTFLKKKKKNRGFHIQAQVYPLHRTVYTRENISHFPGIYSLLSSLSTSTYIYHLHHLAVATTHGFSPRKKKTGTNLEFPFVACINNNCHKRHFFLFPLAELWETTNTTKKNSSFLSNMALKYAICWQLWAAATDLLR